MGKTDWFILSVILLVVFGIFGGVSWNESRYTRGSRTVSGHHLELISKTHRYKHTSNLVFIDQDWFCQEVEARYVRGYPDEIGISVGDTLKLNYTVTLVYKDKKPFYEIFEIDKEYLYPYEYR